MFEVHCMARTTICASIYAFLKKKQNKIKNKIISIESDLNTGIFFFLFTTIKSHSFVFPLILNETFFCNSNEILST